MELKFCAQWNFPMSLAILNWNGAKGPRCKNLCSLKGWLALVSEQALQIHEPPTIHVQFNVELFHVYGMNTKDVNVL